LSEPKGSSSKISRECLKAINHGDKPDNSLPANGKTILASMSDSLKAILKKCQNKYLMRVVKEL
jgi:hypothetical protein